MTDSTSPLQSVLVVVVNIWSAIITVVDGVVGGTIECGDDDVTFELEHAANTAHETITLATQYALRFFSPANQ